MNNLPNGALIIGNASTPSGRQIETTTYRDKTYSVAGEMWFNPATPGSVMDALLNARASGSRVRLYCGDLATGKDWGERYDVTGTVGSSMGPVKVPLLIQTSRSMGGGAISADALVKIRLSAGTKRVLYQHADYHTGVYTSGVNIRPESVAAGYPLALYRDGKQVYGCKTQTQLNREIAFMTS